MDSFHSSGGSVRNIMLALTRVFVFLCVLGGQAFCFDPSFVRLIEDGTNILYPPVRLSAHLCDLRPEDAVSLSRMMSNKGLANEIHLDLHGFMNKNHDTWDHQVLYVVDLDCEYAIPLLRTANASRLFVAPVRWLLLQDRTSATDFTSEITEVFHEMAVYPDSDVIVATKLNVDGFTQIMSVYRPSPYRGVQLENRGNWTADRGVRMANFHAASRRRRDLLQTPLKSCIVVNHPESINHLTDYADKHIDTVAKVNYPWMLHIASRMNANITFVTSDSWGYQDENGTWNGMTGMLNRREIDIGGTGTFLTSQRIGVVDFIQLYTQTSLRFMFRQPLLSTVSNIFTLPFQRSVWLTIAVFLVVVLGLLQISTKWEYKRVGSASTVEYWKQLNPNEQTLSDNLMVVLGAFAQQGYWYEPYRVPSRIVTLMLLIASLNLYASYTANIVALLQSTTDSIKTLEDLLHSPLKLGVEDIVYSRYYFRSFKDQVRRAIVEEKVEPKGHNGSWMTIAEGVHRVRTELFAFHAELGTAYKVVQETYQEEEKCGIMEIDILNVVYPLLPIQIRSPYLEIVKNAGLLLGETGLKYRVEKRLYTARPKCQGQTSFISIGFTECYFALVSVLYGTLLSLVVLLAEHAWYKRSKASTLRMDTFSSSLVFPAAYR